jgi:hypothetical protein
MSVRDENQFALHLGTLQHLVRFDHVIQGHACSDYWVQFVMASGFAIDGGITGVGSANVDDVFDQGLCHVVCATAAELSGRHSKCRPAATSPACQPGARPPAGGLIESTSIPARASNQEICELEFHIS